MRLHALRAATGAAAVAAALCALSGAAVADDKPLVPTLGSVGAAAATPYVTISSTGPLSRIHLGNDLSCQVNISTSLSSGLAGFGGGGQVYGPAYSPADCGTFLAIGERLYGPDFVNHGGSATPFSWSAGYSAFTPVSQTPVTGTGTLTDPYIVTTVVDAGTTGIRLTRIDTYTTGRTYYRSDVVVTNQTPATVSGLRLYHGIDCYLAGSDSGFGVAQTWPTTATSRVGCTNANRTMQLVSQSPGNGYYEDTYYQVWNRINARLALPNTVNPNLIDNGIAIDWSFSLPGYGSVIRSFNTDFVSSPIVIGPVDRLPVEAAVFIEDGDTVPRVGVVVRISSPVGDQQLAVWIPPATA